MWLEIGISWIYHRYIGDIPKVYPRYTKLFEASKCRHRSRKNRYFLANSQLCCTFAAANTWFAECEAKGNGVEIPGCPAAVSRLTNGASPGGYHPPGSVTEIIGKMLADRATSQNTCHAVDDSHAPLGLGRGSQHSQEE